jgi:hypothetical protein
MIPSGTGIGQPGPEQHAPSGGIHIKYMVAEKLRAISPYAPFSGTLGVSTARSSSPGVLACAEVAVLLVGYG